MEYYQHRLFGPIPSFDTPADALAWLDASPRPEFINEPYGDEPFDELSDEAVTISHEAGRWLASWGQHGWGAWVSREAAANAYDFIELSEE